MGEIFRTPLTCCRWHISGGEGIESGGDFLMSDDAIQGLVLLLFEVFKISLAENLLTIGKVNYKF